MDKLLEFVNGEMEHYDSAHGMSHVLTVLDTTHLICDRLEINRNDHIYQTAEIAAALHDIGLFAGRKLHHLAGCEYVRCNITKILSLLSKGYQIDTHWLSMAVYEHRASYLGKYTSIVSEIVSAADRNWNVDMTLWDRAYLTMRSNYKRTHELHYATYNHIREKYGYGGYATANPNNTVMHRLFKEEIEQMQRVIDGKSFSEISMYLTEKFE